MSRSRPPTRSASPGSSTAWSSTTSKADSRAPTPRTRSCSRVFASSRCRGQGWRHSGPRAGAGGTCEGDANLEALAASEAPVWTLVGKSDVWQVANVLQTTNNENLEMVEESVAYGVARGREVIFDAERFFDGHARDAEYAVEVCVTAARAGASWVVLCDTNGGSLPSRSEER